MGNNREQRLPAAAPNISPHLSGYGLQEYYLSPHLITGLALEQIGYQPDASLSQLGWKDGRQAASSIIWTMEDVSVPDMLRVLEEEASVLEQMHRNISNGLNRLQMKAELLMQALEKLGFTTISPKKFNSPCDWEIKFDGGAAQEGEGLIESNDGPEGDEKETYLFTSARIEDDECTSSCDRKGE